MSNIDRVASTFTLVKVSFCSIQDVFPSILNIFSGVINVISGVLSLCPNTSFKVVSTWDWNRVAELELVGACDLGSWDSLCSQSYGERDIVFCDVGYAIDHVNIR